MGNAGLRCSHFGIVLTVVSPLSGARSGLHRGHLQASPVARTTVLMGIGVYFICLIIEKSFNLST